MRPQERQEELPWLGIFQGMGLRLGGQAIAHRMGCAPPPSWNKIANKASEEREHSGPISVRRQPQLNHPQAIEMGWVCLKAITSF